MAVVEVGRFGTRTEAELARGMLATHGYTTHLSDRTEFVYGRGEILGGGISLLVDEQDAAAVQQLLAEPAAVPEASLADDPHQSPFDTSSRLPRARRAQRILWATLGAYGLLQVVQAILSWD